MMKIILLIGITLLACLNAFAEDRALIVGTDIYADVRLPGTDGAADDARAMQALLIEKLGFAPNSVKVFLNEKATAANIVREFENHLINGTRPGDRVFFFYAGHGFQVPDDNGDEKDGQDEVVTPYDVAIKPEGRRLVLPDEKTFIRDDKFNDFIAQLSGRRAVLMFDSCNSGTISRGFPAGSNKLESRYLRLKPSRSITDDGYSDVPKDQKSRDLSIVREDAVDGNVNGVVVFSAASPYQQAFPFYTPDKKIRGAFTYIFEQQIRKDPSIKLDSLEKNLKSDMKKYADDGLLSPGRNGEFQVPQVDVISRIKITDKPLFSASSAKEDYTAAVESAMFNPLSTMIVKLELDRKRYKLGDQIRYKVDVSETAFLYILVFSNNNKAFCIFPTIEDTTTPNKVMPGKYSFPLTDENGDEKYLTEATPPTGKDVWVALISRKKLRLGEKEEYSWDEIFKRIGLDELQKAIADKVARSRGAGNTKTTPLTADDWQANVVVVETVEN